MPTLIAMICSTVTSSRLNPFLYLYLAYFFCLDACVVVEDLPAGDVEDCGVFVVVVGAGVVVVGAGEAFAGDDFFGHFFFEI